MSQYGICLAQRHLPDLRKHIYLKFTAYDRRLREVGNSTVTTSAKKKKTGLWIAWCVLFTILEQQKKKQQ